jgi:hypothetical protein
MLFLRSISDYALLEKKKQNVDGRPEINLFNVSERKGKRKEELT